MSTTITPDEFLAALTKWGVRWRFYSNKADWLTHNRNKAGNNAAATPGGFGPLRGVVEHNTASTSQTGMLTYLYQGDPARQLPGPLCNWATLKTGEVVLMGWGTSNATGPGDRRPDTLVRSNSMPMNGEITPTTSGPADPNAILYAPYYFGQEACHASEGPTDAQRDAQVRTTCAALDCLGGPAQGYGAGSVIGHRELTLTRSDPQGWPKDGSFRRAVEAMFKAGPPKPPTPEPPVLKPVETVLTVDKPAVTQGEVVTLTGTVTPNIPGAMVFDWYDSNTTSWKRFEVARVNENGKAITMNRPSRNVTYRIGFDPDDAAYRNGNYSGNMTVPVVDLARLMFEHKELMDRVAALEAAAGTATDPGAP